jgi:hypothetical protein
VQEGLKKGINKWSFPDTRDLRDCFQLAREAGFAGVELVVADAESSRVRAERTGAAHLASPMSYLGFYPYANPEFTLS